MVTKVLVAVLHWQSPRQAIRAVRSLQASRGVAVDVVVVDNASREPDYLLLKEELKGVVVIRLPTNQGYAGGMNLALRLAQEERVPFVLLVTQDVVADPDMACNLLRAMISESKAGIVGPVVYYLQEPEKVFSAGGYIDKKKAEVGHFQAPLKGEPYEVDWVDGCCMLVRRETLQDTGGFDEAFFMYYEENDFCQRTRRQGWKVMIEPSARAWHEVTLGPRSFAYHYYMAKNAYRFWDKNFGLCLSAVAYRQVCLLARRYAAAGVSLVVPRLRAKVGASSRLLDAFRATKGFVLGTWGYLRDVRR